METQPAQHPLEEAATLSNATNAIENFTGNALGKPDGPLTRSLKKRKLGRVKNAETQHIITTKIVMAQITFKGQMNQPKNLLKTQAYASA